MIYSGASSFLGFTVIPTAASRPDSVDAFIMTFLAVSSLLVPISIGWTKTPSTSLKCYQSNIIHNGQSITIGGEGAKETVDITGKSVLDAYKIVSGGKTYYNTYNLLKGSDDWDPLGVKDVIKAAGQDTVATQLSK